MGTDEEWEAAEIRIKRSYGRASAYRIVINEGDGAFYGPKLDFHLEDSIGRTWQCGTIQLDMQMPQRFDITYVGSDGEKHSPVMIHRVIFGSIERFIGILIEHFAGKFPLWLAPVQVKLLTVTEKYSRLCAGRSRSSSKKPDCVRKPISETRRSVTNCSEARNERNPYICIIGEKEVEGDYLTVRNNKTGEQFEIKPDELQENLLKEIAEKAI